MRKRGQTFLWINLCVAVAFIFPYYVQGAEPSAPRKIRAAFTSLSGSMAPPWVAHEAGILSYPSITRAKKLGHRVLLDIASLGVPYASTGVTTRGKLIQEDPDLVRRYITAQLEAIARIKREKAYAMAVMGKYLRASDPELLSESYEIYAQKFLLKVPLPTVEAIRSVLEELAARNPKAKEQEPKRFFDDSFVRQLETSGFIGSLYR